VSRITTKHHIVGRYAFKASMPRVGLATDREEWQATIDGAEIPGRFATLEEAMRAVLDAETPLEATRRALNVEDVAKALWRVTCEEANYDERRMGRAPQQWADPWDASGCGKHQQAIYRRQAEWFIAALAEPESKGGGG